MDKELREMIRKQAVKDLKYLEEICEGTPEREKHVSEILKLIEALENDELENKKISSDWTKIGVGVLTTIAGYGAYAYFQHKVLKFEEFGRVVSTAGRDLKLPRFMK